MTRKQAIEQAIQLIGEGDVSDKLKAILDELPLTYWTKDNILDAIDQHILDYGTLPKMRDYDGSDTLPAFTTIKNKFKMNLTQFYETYYHDILLKSKPSVEEIEKNFIEEYNRIKPTSEREFDTQRNNGVFCVQMICRYLKINTWFGLIEKYNLVRYKKVRGKDGCKIVDSYQLPTNINRSIDLEEKLKKLYSA